MPVTLLYDEGVNVTLIHIKLSGLRWLDEIKVELVVPFRMAIPIKKIMFIRGHVIIPDNYHHHYHVLRLFIGEIASALLSLVFASASTTSPLVDYNGHRASGLVTREMFALGIKK